MKKFDKADKVYFELCGLAFILSLLFLYFTPLGLYLSVMTSFVIAYSLGFVICLIWKKKHNNLINNETNNNKNTNT
jgi:hypothetical protein